ncbi:MAG: prephenate dehydrogenase [Candidatus Omnitrophota bacterium]
MKKFNKVAIVGIGLIGGSMAKIIKKRKLAKEVVGVSRRKKNLLLAKRSGAIDKGSQSLEIVKDADLLIFATPVETIINLAPLVSKLVRKDCIVTDVGSTKRAIASRLEKLFPHYIGSHPLAGSEKQHIANACVGMFKDSLCILTPTKSTKTKSLSQIRMLWQEMGAKTILLSPEEHDKILSFVSHLPHIAAFSLMGAIPGRYLKFAASGLKDTTRIASSGGELRTDIIFSNKNNISRSIKVFQHNLSKINLAIETNDKRHLVSILSTAKKKRVSLD